MNPRDLPVYEIAGAIESALRAGDRLVVQAPTGSGKSTQIPQILLDRGLVRGGIVVLQPRRLPTRLLAARVASERHSALGGEVGYQMRFERVISDATRIRFVTEGVLLRQMIERPDLPGVGALIFDEFHERHIQTDLGLAMARRIAEQRPGFKLVVMSATIDAAAVAEYLAPCEVLSSAGRTFPVEIAHLDRTPDPEHEPVWETAARALETIAPNTSGDVLVFMPGSREIHRTIRAIQEGNCARQFVAMPLHGEMQSAEQDAVFAPCDRRKVIVSTNVAETSLTIDGVRTVIDSGQARIPRFDPVRGINTLMVEKISRASSDQRAGRAGRTAPGYCLRLWTARDHTERAARELPEIRRLDLCETVLSLRAWGAGNLLEFPWVEAPAPRAIERAETLLADLGALESAGGGLTKLGRRMLAFPVHPRHARMFLAAGEHGCVRAVALIAALTQGRPVLLRSTGRAMDQRRKELFGEEEFSDFFLLSRAWRFAVNRKFHPDACRPLGIHAQSARQVGPVLDQFLRLAADAGLNVSEQVASPEAVARCILAGFSDQVARRLDGGTLRCALVHGRRATLVRESAVRDRALFVGTEIRETGGGGRDAEVLISQATAIEPDWLREMFAGDFSENEVTAFDPTAKRVISRRTVRFRDLVLEEGKAGEPGADAAARALAAEVAAGRLPLEHWDDAVEQWILRLAYVARHFPEMQLPLIGMEERLDLMEHICHGATSAREIRDRAVWPVVRGWLTDAQRDFVERNAPEKMKLPGGQHARLVYAAEGPPVLAARIQELFGVKDGFVLASGRDRALIHVLAPNRRPVQVTVSLGRFWSETYPEIRPQLQRRYPKHDWRENPLG